MHKRWLLLIPFVLVIAAAFWLDDASNRQTAYLGLPPTPCIDPAVPFRQDFTFTLKITVEGEDRPLDPAIGHDYGHCLHVIHTDDASGTVHVQANDLDTYTLGNFFDTWHWPFRARLLLGETYPRRVVLRVDGVTVTTYEKTPLKPGSLIEIDAR